MRTIAILSVFTILVSAQAATLTASLHSPAYDIDAQYGNSLAMLPDVTGDGIAELVVAAHRETAGGYNWAGNVYVYRGGDFQILYTLTAPVPEGTAMFGFAVAAIPDVTGDSLSDILVSSPFENTNGVTDAGKVYLFSGANGQLVRSYQPPQLVSRGYFGHSLASAGDVDNDGHVEILIGCVGQGKVFVYDGVNGNWKREYDPPILDGCISFGYVVAGLGDISGDGRPDYMAGAFCQGRAFTFIGATGALRDTLGESSLTDQGFGYSLAGLPDIDNDGRADIMVGSPYSNYDSVTYNTGLVKLISGANRTVLRTLYAPNPISDSWFGLSLASVGDVNGDGTTDVFIGMPNDGYGSDSLSGRGYLYNAVTGMLIDSIASPNVQAASNFSWVVTGGLDITGDGRPDFVAAAPYEDYLNTENAGGVYVYSFPASAAQQSETAIPTTTIITNAYPNPFNATTTIAYRVPASGNVAITVTDISGRVVADAVNRHAVSGTTYRWQFDAQELASGIYFYRITSGSNHTQQKLVLVK
ncbi:MAG: FG-GAP-like repeat-containing protein [bacterium]|nr:FG-GAP-like repeat-containing protein [bacterium]